MRKQKVNKGVDIFMRKPGIIIGSFIKEMSVVDMSKVKQYSYNHTFKMKGSLERLDIIERIGGTADYNLTIKGLELHKHLEVIIKLCEK